MDKETLSNYGWIVICVLVMAVMIALSTPFGNYIKDAVWSTTQGLFDTGENALGTIGISNGKYTPPLVNIRDSSEWNNGYYVDGAGNFEANPDSIYVRIPVTEGENWVVWYESETKLSSAYGGLRFENSEKEKLSNLNMSTQPKYAINPESDVLGAVIKIPEGVSYMCINLKVGTLYDYTESAFIAQVNPAAKWATLGDSITAFDAKASKNYVEIISNQLSLSVNNLGVGGMGYARNGGFITKANKLPSDVGLITIYGSFNDLDTGLSIGSASDTYIEGAENTLAAYMNYTYDYIQTNYPNAKIAVITPAPWNNTDPSDATNVSSKYVEVMKEICESRNIPCFDLYHSSGMTPWDNEYNNQYFVGDGVHPNNEGHKILATKIIPFLQSVLNS